MDELIFSIIIPTLNSEKTLEFTLQSIKDQRYNPNLIEILVIDGGSKDKTLEIAKKFNCKLIHNPDIQQEFAKFKGLKIAKGRFAVFLDSDEVFENQFALADRYSCFESNKKLKFVHSGGYLAPEFSHPINNYINYFSDPFAYFMYGISSESKIFIQSWKSKNQHFEENKDSVLFYYNAKSTLSNVDVSAGNTIDIDFIRSKVNLDEVSINFISSIFLFIISYTKCSAILKNDAIIHNSADTLLKYLNKLKWRVITNIHYNSIPGVGYSNREEYLSKSFKFKKYFFLIYGVSFIWPLYHSLKLYLNNKKKIFFIHPILSIYLALIIIYYMLLKFLKIKPKIHIYGLKN